jgi:hypothetical protein
MDSHYGESPSPAYETDLGSSSIRGDLTYSSSTVAEHATNFLFDHI